MKKISMEKFVDNFKCKCENTVHEDDFYPCNENGEYIEPDDLWDGLYKCVRCKMIYSTY